jgi:ribosomal protein S27AE
LDRLRSWHYLFGIVEAAEVPEYNETIRVVGREAHCPKCGKVMVQHQLRFECSKCGFAGYIKLEDAAFLEAINQPPPAEVVVWPSPKCGRPVPRGQPYCLSCQPPPARDAQEVDMLHFVETQRKWNKQKELNYKPDFWAKWVSNWRLFWAWQDIALHLPEAITTDLTLRTEIRQWLKTYFGRVLG